MKPIKKILVPLDFSPHSAQALQFAIDLARRYEASLDLHRAEPRKHDLIVMGTHGRSGIKRVFLGSVAENVLRSTKCPVLVVRVSASAVNA